MNCIITLRRYFPRPRIDNEHQSTHFRVFIIIKNIELLAYETEIIIINHASFAYDNGCL